MKYVAKCPYCGSWLKSGHGSPWKTIGSPVKPCPRCSRGYIDNDIYEWSVIGIGPKLWFYLFANNRVAPWVLLLITVPATESWLYFGIGAVVWSAFCVLWVNTTKKKQIEESARRTEGNDQYIQLLINSGYYKLSLKHYPLHMRK